MVLVHDTTNRVHSLWHGMGDGYERIGRSLLADLAALAAITPRPEVVLCAFDCGPSFRSAICPAYKSSRSKKPQGLVDAMHYSFDAVRDAGFTALEAPGFEADDILATVARRAVDDGRQCVIVSPDKDARQCLRAGQVSILKSYRRDGDRLANPVWLTEAGLRQAYGVGPERWTDWQAIAGDATDDIQGWRGAGEGAAKKWLASHSLDEIVAAPTLVEMTATQRASLDEFRERLPIVRQLVTLRADVPL